MKYSYVYFISDDHGHIKIGKADDVYKRLKELQIGNPYKLNVLLSIIVDSSSYAYSLESELHNHFKEYRLESEWFEAAPILDLIDTNIVQLNKFQFGGLKYGKKD